MNVCQCTKPWLAKQNENLGADGKVESFMYGATAFESFVYFMHRISN